jgi:hypothetical protein
MEIKFFITHIITQVKHAIDKDTAEGILGVSMAIGFPFIDFLTKIFQFLGAGGGLILLYFAIRHKILEIRKLKREENGNIKR